MNQPIDPVTAELVEIVLDGVEDRNLRGVLAGLVHNGELQRACELKDRMMRQSPDEG